MMFAKKINNAFLLTAIILSIFILNSCDSKETSVNENQAKTVVSVAKVENKILENSLNNFGSVVFKSKNDVTNLVEGAIYNLNVKEGDSVKKGQVLCKLRNVQLEIQKKQYESSLESAQAALDIQTVNLKDQEMSIKSRLLSIEKSKLSIAQKELERELQLKDYENQKKLHEIGGVTDSEIEKLELSLKASETDLQISKKELEISSLGMRDQDLIDNGIVPSADEETKIQQIIKLNTRSARAQLDSARAQLDASKKQLEAVNILIDELTIKAPVSGIVGSKYFENGEYVKANEKILTLIDTSSVYIAFYIQEQDMVNFELGAAINSYVPSIDKKIESVIDEISPIADSQSGNFSVKTIVQNKDGKLKPGMFVKCTLLKGVQEKYPCVADTVLISNNDTNAKVFCVVNNLAVIKSINIKAHKDGKIWIESGINTGDVVINKPSPFLKEGQYVEVKK